MAMKLDLRYMKVLPEHTKQYIKGSKRMKAKSKYLINDYLPNEELSDQSKIDWEEVNEFYRWQLIRRNEDYIQFYNSNKENPILIRNGQCLETWKIEPLSDPKELFPCFTSAKYLHDNFIEVGRYSYQTIHSDLSKTRQFSIMDDLSTSLIHLTSEVQTSEENDNRFLVLAIDLDKEFTAKNQKDLIEGIHSLRNKYTSKGRYFSKRSIDEIEKNFFVFDYVLETGSFIGIEKKFLETFNTKSDRSTLNKRYETIKKHISIPNQIKFNLNTVNS